MLAALSRSLPRRPQSRGEEIANSISHGLGFLGVLVTAPLLIGSATTHGDSWALLASILFCLSMAAVYGASTLYHAWPRPRLKSLFGILDHIAIYFLIAGSYTPYTLGVLREGSGFGLTLIVWSLALFGAVAKSRRLLRNPVASVSLYLVMGWLVIIAFGDLRLSLSPAALFWLCAGGACYTLGVVFYLAQNIPYAHFVWHLFVIAGTASQAFSIYLTQQLPV